MYFLSCEEIKTFIFIIIDIVKYEAKEPDECLSRYFADIRKSYGSHYEP